MLFHTWTFAVFFLIVYAVYVPTRGSRFSVYWLFAASHLFYAWWNPVYLLLLFATTFIDWLIVIYMKKSRRPKLWLIFSLVSNFGFLAFFKYTNFMVANLDAVFGWLGVSWYIPDPHIMLPIGISFHTFQSMSYTIDAYYGVVETERSFIRFGAFVSFFPQLVAGPIERAKNLLGQMYGRREITRQHLTDGLSLILVGLFKKVAIADYLATYVDQVYAAPTLFNAPALALATFAFAWQIYCDFSGYTDMARGIARLMGFNLMLNFNNPYLATGLGEFWQRWHISLSTWFKDYVYIPLGGNRGGPVRTYVNMFLTMILSGIWHGASWTFVIWGFLHAVGRLLTRELERTRLYGQGVPKLVKQLLVFAFVSLTWIFFRATSLHDAIIILTRLATTPLTDPQFPALGYALCFGLWGYEYAFESRYRHFLELGTVRVLTAAGMIVYLLLFASSRSQTFIYFQF
jgi:alginate O-acetyltransferase complex protein AlgI